MALKKTHDAVYAGEKYTDREGNEKTRYVNMGALFTRDDGSMCLKLESIPVGFTGWVSFYEPKVEQTHTRPQRTVKPSRAPVKDCPQPDQGGFEDDDIPF